ncbi:hypothetical protein AMTR_s00031p00197430, partial [Amborella trichopoda]
FKWEDVKVDKHRENYVGHSIMAPVGRWQKGKDLHWYARDKKTQDADMEAAKAEIQRIKEEEEQAMREALGLAPKRSVRSQGNRLDKHEYVDLVKRGTAVENLAPSYAEADRVQGLGFSRIPSNRPEHESPHPSCEDSSPEKPSKSQPLPEKDTGDAENHQSGSKRRRDEKRIEKHERREKHRHHSEEKRKHKREKGKRRHGSDSGSDN